jgi:hypothetical protein
VILTDRLQNDIVVFISTRDSTCAECGQELEQRAWITLDSKKNALCLNCADLDHLVFLPSGDAALTRRSRKYSKLSAVVVKWSRAHKRYERQGLLVENEALECAEKDCTTDEGSRKLARERAAARREAREKVSPEVFRILDRWQHGEPQD